MYSASEVKRQVYEAIAGKLRRESLCDIDDPEFIDMAMQVQNHIAAQYEKRAAKIRI